VVGFVKQGLFVRLETCHFTIVQNQVILATYVKSVSMIMRNQIIDRDSCLPLVLLEVGTRIHRYLQYTQIWIRTTLVYVGNTKQMLWSTHVLTSTL
jgi:hypothetical protein